MYAIVDIETTGGTASSNGITEVAIYVHNGKKMIKEFHSLINPGRAIPSFITTLTGITNAMVAASPSFEEVAEEIFELLSGNIFIAHNVNFDYSFLRHSLQTHGFDLVAKKLCTVRLSRKIFPNLPSYSLGNLCRSLNIEIENRHRANGDARATMKLFEMMLQQGEEHISAMLKRSSSEQWLPMHLDKKVIDRLPIGPGVYFFHDQKGKVIYVGKAINIRKRVSSHFTTNNAEQRRQHFLRLVHNITCTPCASELHALVYESTQIKKLWPKYNYSQKQPLNKYAIYHFEDNRGYIRLAIDKKRKNIPSLYSFSLLQEGLEILKKLVHQFQLNLKLCYIDKTPVTENDALEPSELYNNKVKNAIQSLNASLPTFAIVDRGIKEKERLCLLMEKGSFWGMGYLPNNLTFKKSEEIKELLEPFSDNDYIRKSVFAYALANPAKTIFLQ